MIVTGVAHNPERLYERSSLPSNELVYLAKAALQAYSAGHLITGLSLGWEMALAKAAIEMEIPYHVAIPGPGREAGWERGARRLYLDLLARAEQVEQISVQYDQQALIESICRRIDQSEMVLGLWDYTFEGMTYESIDYALITGRPVVNLWQEWRQLYTLRRRRSIRVAAPAPSGARVF